MMKLGAAWRARLGNGEPLKAQRIQRRASRRMRALIWSEMAFSGASLPSRNISSCSSASCLLPSSLR